MGPGVRRFPENRESNMWQCAGGTVENNARRRRFRRQRAGMALEEPRLWCDARTTPGRAGTRGARGTGNTRGMTLNWKYWAIRCSGWSGPHWCSVVPIGVQVRRPLVWLDGGAPSRSVPQAENTNSPWAFGTQAQGKLCGATQCGLGSGLGVVPGGGGGGVGNTFPLGRFSGTVQPQ